MFCYLGLGEPWKKYTEICFKYAFRKELVVLFSIMLGLINLSLEF